MTNCRCPVAPALARARPGGATEPQRPAMRAGHCRGDTAAFDAQRKRQRVARPRFSARVRSVGAKVCPKSGRSGRDAAKHTLVRRSRLHLRGRIVLQL